jgi:probable addiction module antidote protein
VSPVALGGAASPVLTRTAGSRYRPGDRDGEASAGGVRTRYTRCDAVDYLDDDEVIAEYLTAALEDDDPELLLATIKDVARARGMTNLARDSGVGRESLYEALAPGAKSRYDRVMKVTRALGVRLHAEPARRPASAGR